MFGNLLQLARPSHWTKNVFVLFPIVFAIQTDNPRAWLGAGLAAAAFCLAASGVYALNDIRDREKDRRHPSKKLRPVASGAVTVRAAGVFAAVAMAAGLGVAAAVGPSVTWVVLGYLVTQAAYTFLLKEQMLIDVMLIAFGFVLRATAGALAIGAVISPWLIVCTFTLCLFIGFCKRRTEIAQLSDAETAGEHRSTLLGYTPELLTHLITLSAGIAIVAFLLYTTSRRTVEHLGTPYLAFTLPAVIYAVCRFAMLSIEGKYMDPTDLVLHDRPFQIAVGIWGLAALAVIHAQSIGNWLAGP